MAFLSRIQMIPSAGPPSPEQRLQNSTREEKSEIKKKKETKHNLLFSGGLNTNTKNTYLSQERNTECL